MTELEKHLLEALEQAQAQQQQREADLLKMFESTKQDNLSVRQIFKDTLETMREIDLTRSENLNKLVRQVSNLSFQVQDFKTQNKALIEQLQELEMQVSKLKKWTHQNVSITVAGSFNCLKLPKVALIIWLSNKKTR